MAQYDGSIRINTQLNTKEFDRSAEHLKGSMVKLGGSIKGLVGALGFAIGVAGLVKLGKEAIETASDIQEVQNVVDTAFGSMSYKMEQFADTAVKQFGMSRLSAKEMGSTFMAMGKSMVGSMEEASDMAIALAGRAADMASFYNKSVNETATALKSIYTGETETLKAYGVVMTEVNLQEYASQQGIKKKISAMTQAEKVQLRYNYVMGQTSLAAGDFAKTSGSWANQTRILSEQFKELLSILGSGLVTALTPAIQFLNTILTQLIAVASQIGAVLSKLLGVSLPVADAKKFADDMSAAAGGAGDLADGVEEAGKEAKKALAPFDDLMVLEDKSGGKGKDIGASGGGFEIPKLDMKDEAAGVGEMGAALDSLLGKITPIIDKFKELGGIFEGGFRLGLGDFVSQVETIKTGATSIADSLTGIFADPGVVSAADGWLQSTAEMLGSLTGMVAGIGLTIGANLIGGVDQYLAENGDRIKGFLTSMFDIRAEINGILTELFQSISYVFGAFGEENGQTLTANLIGIFANAFMGVMELAERLTRDILNIFIQPFVDNQEAFRTALDGFLGVLGEVAGTVKDMIDETFRKLLEVYDEHFKPFFDSIAEGVSEITESFLEFWNENVQPILDSLAEKFDEVMSQHVQPMINKGIELLGKISDFLKVLWETIVVPFVQWIIENILPVILPIFEGLWKGFLEVVGYISDMIGGLIEMFQGVIDFLIGVFTGDWELAWTGISEFVIGWMTEIKGFIDAVMATIGTIFITVLNYIKAKWTIIFTAIGDFIEMITGVIAGVIKGFMSIIRSVISSVLDAIKGTWETVWNGIIVIFEGVKETFSDIWDGIKRMFEGVIEFLTGVFTGDWKKAWEGIKDIFGGIGDAIRRIINNILGGVETLVNGVIRGVNAMIRALNGISFSVPDWVPWLGGKSFGLNLGELSEITIPRLATGTVLRGGNPYMAIVNDQPRGQVNVEAPLATIKQAVREELAGLNLGNDNVQIRGGVYMDGMRVGELSVDGSLSEMKRRGFNVEVLGVT